MIRICQNGSEPGFLRTSRAILALVHDSSKHVASELDYPKVRNDNMILTGITSVQRTHNEQRSKY